MSHGEDKEPDSSRFAKPEEPRRNEQSGHAGGGGSQGACPLGACGGPGRGLIPGDNRRGTPDPNHLIHLLHKCRARSSLQRRIIQYPRTPCA
ncbi:unnamed protein product [Pleuronectes platessa]|uniref:Uncharacterized protein n=1 Tax=Pleuronectes platessa TaxID=8262 RepID=A0A9N7Y9G4_PLEPL|nr:unnamed protein product [Pleuronectes platessa]